MYELTIALTQPALQRRCHCFFPQLFSTAHYPSIHCKCMESLQVEKSIIIILLALGARCSHSFHVHCVIQINLKFIDHLIYPTRVFRIMFAISFGPLFGGKSMPAGWCDSVNGRPRFLFFSWRTSPVIPSVAGGLACSSKIENRVGCLDEGKIDNVVWPSESSRKLFVGK